MDTLPRDLVIQYIIPFTYSPQCKDLQRDITTYYFTITKLKKLYQETLVPNYNEKQLYWLMNINIIRFCRNNQLSSLIYKYKHITNNISHIRQIIASLNGSFRLKFIMGAHYVFDFP